MQIAVELRNGKEKVARFQTEVANGEKEFSKLVNLLSDIVFGDVMEPRKMIPEKVDPVTIHRKAEIRPKKWEPEVISQEVVVHDSKQEKPKGMQREIMLIARCECGNTRIFKTLDNSGRTFKCDCGKEYPIENSVRVIAVCPNCGNPSHGFRTLQGMDISDFLKCKQCESPIDLKFNSKNKIWENL